MSVITSKVQELTRREELLRKHPTNQGPFVSVFLDTSATQRISSKLAFAIHKEKKKSENHKLFVSFGFLSVTFMTAALWYSHLNTHTVLIYAGCISSFPF